MNTLLPEYETWQPPESAVAIEYTKPVVEEVRDQAVAGYRRLARGGVEVGGILYGFRDDAKVRVLATQVIACEYKSGPSFVLSERDKQRLRDQLASAPSLEELKGMIVVGWYVSHPRGEVSLTDRDLEVFNEFFPDIWNIALVLKPNATGVRGGFFVREPRGSLSFARSYQEFELGMPRSAEGASAVRQIAEQVGSSLAAQRDSAAADADLLRRRGGGRRDVAEMPMAVPRFPNQDLPRAFVPSGIPISQMSGGGAAAAAAAPAPEAEAVPSVSWSRAVARPRSAILAQRQQHPRRLKWRWLFVWAAFVVCAMATSYLYHEFTAPAPLGLRVVEKDGDLYIRWDPGSRSIQWANSGKLEIGGSNGAAKKEINLSGNDLAAGAFQYGGPEGDASIRLVVSGSMGFHADESTRYIARVSQPDAPTPVPEMKDRRQLQAEVQRLRDELEKSQQRVKELESLLYSR